MSREEYQVIEAYLNLLKAIRDQANRDGFIDEFEDYWFYNPEIINVWRIICEEAGVFVDGISADNSMDE